MSGGMMWCPDPDEVWQLYDVEDHGNHVVVKNIAHLVRGWPSCVSASLSSGGNRECSIDKTHPYDPSHGDDFEDVSQMNDLHVAPLLALLRRRYAEDNIYTFAGEVLVSINPYHYVTKLKSTTPEDVARGLPHVHTVAHRAYTALQSCNSNQVVIVSGESGAGKTEAAKEIMRHLALAATERLTGATSSNDKTSGSLSQVANCVLQANPLLETFGNAKTVRNDNSSRFGKLVQICYQSFQSRVITGAVTTHFLIEKSRVVHQGPGERNYHVFYQLCAGAASKPGQAALKEALSGAEGGGVNELVKRMGLKPSTEFEFCRKGVTPTIDGVDDVAAFKQTVELLRTFEVSAEQLRGLLSLVAAVLHLGELTYGNDEDISSLDHAEGNACVARIADLLGLAAPGHLAYSLTVRTLKAPGRQSMQEIPLTPAQAAGSRDALAKTLYASIFSWVVGKVNAVSSVSGVASTSSSSAVSAFIAVLDIFGFEIFEHNSFEQLLINYTNERLQTHFNKHVFAKEQEMYAQEGVDCTSVTYVDNVPTVELLSKKPSGVLPLLDEQAMLGARASASNWHSGMVNAHKQHPSFIVPRHSGLAAPEFTIRHYAGDVTYSVEGMLYKNNDALQPQLMELVRGSQLPLLHDVLGADEQQQQDSMLLARSLSGSKAASPSSRSSVRAPRRQGSKMAGTATVSRRFTEQMNGLMAVLEATQAHFVRCIKPNTKKEPQCFDSGMTHSQLAYLGVLETVRIRREGYPNRMPFWVLLRRYRPLWQELTGSKGKPDTGDGRKECQALLSKWLDQKHWQLGHTKAFLTDHAERELVQQLNAFVGAHAITIQRWVRICLPRRRLGRAARERREREEEEKRKREIEEKRKREAEEKREKEDMRKREEEAKRQNEEKRKRGEGEKRKKEEEERKKKEEIERQKGEEEEGRRSKLEEERGNDIRRREEALRRREEEAKAKAETRRIQEEEERRAKDENAKEREIEVRRREEELSRKEEELIRREKEGRTQEARRGEREDDESMARDLRDWERAVNESRELEYEGYEGPGDYSDPSTIEALDQMRVLSGDETVLKCSFVLKDGGVFGAMWKMPCFLVLTSLPRLLLVDPEKRTLVASCSRGVSVESLSPQRFVVFVGQSVYRFTSVYISARSWLNALNMSGLALVDGRNGSEQAFMTLEEDGDPQGLIRLMLPRDLSKELACQLQEQFDADPSAGVALEELDISSDGVAMVQKVTQDVQRLTLAPFLRDDEFVLKISCVVKNGWGLSYWTPRILLMAVTSRPRLVLIDPVEGFVEEKYSHRLGAQLVSDHQFAVQANASYTQFSSLLTPSRQWVEIIHRTMGGALLDLGIGYDDDSDDDGVVRSRQRSSRLGCSGPLSLFDSMLMPAPPPPSPKPASRRVVGGYPEAQAHQLERSNSRRIQASRRSTSSLLPQQRNSTSLMDAVTGPGRPNADAKRRLTKVLGSPEMKQLYPPRVRGEMTRQLVKMGGDDALGMYAGLEYDITTGHADFEKLAAFLGATTPANVGAT